MRKIRRSIFAGVVLAAALAPFMFIQDVSVTLEELARTHYALSSLAYVFLLAASVVFAPLAMPVFFVAGGIFGVVAAAFYNVLGWGLGAAVAFLLARFLKEAFLSRFVPLEKLAIYESRIPRDFEFLSIVLLRIVTPVDILSYTLGLFSTISFTRYIAATIIGITPFAVVFSYGGGALLDGKYVLAIALAALAVVSAGIGFFLFRAK